MVTEAKGQVHSRLVLNTQPLSQEEQRFVQVGRDALINKAIKGSLGIPPLKPATESEVSDFNQENYLHTKLSETLDTEKHTVVIDTRYVPNSAEKNNLKPEISVTETGINGHGDATSFSSVRDFPPDTSRVVVETIHRLMVGVLIDGGTGKNVVRIYDKAMAELNEGSSAKDLIEAFRMNSLRGGALSYLKFRYAEGIESQN